MKNIKHFEFSFIFKVLNLETSFLDNLLENIATFIRKIYMFNLHLNISFYVTLSNSEIETILELNNFTLAPPSFKEILEYLEKLFGDKIENYFVANSSNIQMLIMFHNFNLSTDSDDLFLDIIPNQNQNYDINSINLIRSITNNSNFSKTLLALYGIKIENSTDINKIKIKNINNKSIILILNIGFIDNEVNLIDQINQMLIALHKEIKDKNLFLVMDEKERKILKIYEKDMNIISQSFLDILKITQNSEIQEKLIKFIDLGYNLNPSEEELDSCFMKNLNSTLFKNSLKNIIKK